MVVPQWMFPQSHFLFHVFLQKETNAKRSSEWTLDLGSHQADFHFFVRVTCATEIENRTRKSGLMCFSHKSYHPFPQFYHSHLPPHTNVRQMFWTCSLDKSSGMAAISLLENCWWCTHSWKVTAKWQWCVKNRCMVPTLLQVITSSPPQILEHASLATLQGWWWTSSLTPGW